MTNEEIVLARFSKMAKSPLSFGKGYYWWEQQKFNPTDLKQQTSIRNRVFKIIQLCEDYATYIKNTNRLQCNAGASRSAQDIWRIYQYYFDDIDIFSILRELYYLSIQGKISSGRCFVVKKRVFDISPPYNDFTDWKPKCEFGVSIKDWKNIGLGVNNEG